MNKFEKAIIIEVCIIIALCVLIACIAPTVIEDMDWFKEATPSRLSSTQEKQIFNSKFESYASEKQSPDNTKALIGAVIASNESNATGDGCKGIKQISIETNFYTDEGEETWTPEYLSKVRSAVKQGNTYKVELIYGQSGIVTEIFITQNADVQGNTL